MASSLPNGQTNADKSKNFVNLRYYLLDGNNQPISAELAADTINLLTDQEFAQYLGQEVVQKGQVELQPRQEMSGSNQQLWIIGAVLGPIAVLFAVFWIVLFLYYKCINPRKRLESKSKSRIINSESPDSVNRAQK